MPPAYLIYRSHGHYQPLLGDLAELLRPAVYSTTTLITSFEARDLYGGIQELRLQTHTANQSVLRLV